MLNSELLAQTDAKLLGSIERQRRFILQKLVFPMPCPNCSNRVTWFAAAGLAVDELDLERSGTSEHACKCPTCKRGLKYTVPFVAVGAPGWEWRLVPITAPAEEA